MLLFVLSYGISTTLLQYLFLYDFLFIHLKASIGVLEKGYLNIRKYPSIGVLKKQLLRKFLHTLHTFQQNIQGGVLLNYTCRPSWDCSKKLFRAAILQTGIYRSNLDVRYSAQKTQSFNRVLKLNLNVYIPVCFFVCFVTEILEFICSNVFSS